MKWKGKLIKQLILDLKNNTNWKNAINKIEEEKNIGIHLAVFNEPFLSLVLTGEKTIESRFSVNRISPYGKVNKGDVIILKVSGGPVKGVCIAGDIDYYSNLNKTSLKEIKDNYADLICSDHDRDFWEKRTNANYATLIDIKRVTKLEPFSIGKRDRAGWSVLRESFSKTIFD